MLELFPSVLSDTRCNSTPFWGSLNNITIHLNDILGVSELTACSSALSGRISECSHDSGTGIFSVSPSSIFSLPSSMFSLFFFCQIKRILAIILGHNLVVQPPDLNSHWDMTQSHWKVSLLTHKDSPLKSRRTFQEVTVSSLPFCFCHNYTAHMHNWLIVEKLVKQSMV